MKTIPIGLAFALLALPAAALADSPAERAARAAERQADAAERAARAAEVQADAVRRAEIERCFARGERERCLAMMDPFEQSAFTAYEGSTQAGRGLGEVLRALIGNGPTEEERRAAVVLLRALHPDHEQILADPSFRRWVADSPARRELLVKAHTQFDVSAAHALFSAWKQQRGAQ